MKSSRNWYFLTVVSCGVLAFGPVSTLGKSRSGTPVTFGRISFVKSWIVERRTGSAGSTDSVHVWLATKS